MSRRLAICAALVTLIVAVIAVFSGGPDALSSTGSDALSSGRDALASRGGALSSGGGALSDSGGALSGRDGVVTAGARPSRTRVYHVSSAGNDGNDGGSAGDAFATVGRAVAAVQPGDTIRVHRGTYRELVRIRQPSGTAAAPIVLTSAGDGEALLTWTSTPQPCSARSPSDARTLQLIDGVDHWRIEQLTIEGGILVAGRGDPERFRTITSDKRLPGNGARDSLAHARIIPEHGGDGADHIRIVGNELRGRGVYTKLARWGVVDDNEIHQVECGTGPGILLSRFSSFWHVHDNFVHDTRGAENHFMCEGIRHANASSYNLTERNRVEDIGGTCRGITTDVNASWNRILENTVARAAINFSEQQGGWGNEWTRNSSIDPRRSGYSVFTKGAKRRSPYHPEDDGVPAYLRFSQNKSQGARKDFEAEALAKSEFEGNEWRVVGLGRTLRKGWRENGNRWEGKDDVPEDMTERAGGGERERHRKVPGSDPR
ncbi:MAG: hypothetical protein H0V09_10935 [Gemmatimonadetes bacterium]|nr:hypothetical protein [Gemmatimonadota bacterium]